MSTGRATGTEQHASFDPGYNWVLFAAVLLMILGAVDLIEGLAAVGNSAFFVRKSHFIIGDLSTWGWVVVILGTAQFVVGFALLVKQQLARWIGVGLLGLDVLVQLLLFPADPLWSVIIVGLDVLAMYALIVHGEVASAAR
jgi:hypothetical protein